MTSKHVTRVGVLSPGPPASRRLGICSLEVGIGILQFVSRSCSGAASTQNSTPNARSLGASGRLLAPLRSAAALRPTFGSRPAFSSASRCTRRSGWYDGLGRVAWAEAQPAKGSGRRVFPDLGRDWNYPRCDVCHEPAANRRPGFLTVRSGSKTPARPTAGIRTGSATRSARSVRPPPEY